MEQTTAQTFQELGKRYGFRVTKNKNTYHLSAKNTDGDWCDWINFYPDKNLVTYQRTQSVS